MTAVIHHHGSRGTTPLVLLHAFPLDARMWDEVIALLPRQHIIAVDLPGFGESAASADPQGPTLESMADAVATALTEAGVDRAVFAGLSMGGYVAMALAERHREMITGLALLSTKAAADPPAARETRLEVARQAMGTEGAGAVAAMVDKLVGLTTTGTRPRVRAQVSTWLSEAPPHGIAGAQRAMAARPDRHQVLAGLQVPALVVHGAEDALATADDHDRMADQLGVDVMTLNGAGHLCAVEVPAEVAVALADLMGRAGH